MFTAVGFQHRLEVGVSSLSSEGFQHPLMSARRHWNEVLQMDKLTGIISASEEKQKNPDDLLNAAQVEAQVCSAYK